MFFLKDILDLNFPDYPFVFPILKSCNFSKRLIFLYPAKNNPMKFAILQKYRVGNTVLPKLHNSFGNSFEYIPTVFTLLKKELLT